MKYLLLLPILSLGSFLIYYWGIKKDNTGKRYGMQVTISATFKLIESKFAKIYWYIMMALIALPMLAIGQSPWFLGAAFALLIVGCTPQYWKDGQEHPHIIGAIACLTLPMFALVFDLKMWWLVVPYILFALITEFPFKNKDKKTTLIQLKHSGAWVEVVGFLIIILGLYLS